MVVIFDAPCVPRPFTKAQSPRARCPGQHAENGGRGQREERHGRTPQNSRSSTWTGGVHPSE